MDFHTANARYEAWLRRLVPVYESDLKLKHTQMANRFPFFRGTYFRWATEWPRVCEHLTHGPRLPSVGDLHVENFGNWRDGEGRLCWGVNDFDEADTLPYTNDLTRLAVSLKLLDDDGLLKGKFQTACATLLDGYAEMLQRGGEGFVLEEKHPELRAMAMHADREPLKFWNKLNAKLIAPQQPVPPDAVAAIRDASLPAAAWQIHIRPEVGMGSLGKPRYVGVADWRGGNVAREVKWLTPPATAPASRLSAVLATAKRSHDPTYRVVGNWVVRRLAPRCTKIDVEEVKSAVDIQALVRGMGAETANVHLGADQGNAILADLTGLPKGWLADAAEAMAAAVDRDWNEYTRSA